MGVTVKSRVCEYPGCGTRYQPTGNRQKFCPEHSRKLRRRASQQERRHGPLPQERLLPEKARVERRASIAEVLERLMVLGAARALKWTLTVESGK